MRINETLVAVTILLGVITSGCASSRSASPAFVEGDAPPGDANFTLYCDVIRGDGHIAVARALQKELVAATGLHTWHIVHNTDESILLCGYYRSFDSQGDARDHALAQADRRKIVELKDAKGERRFPFVIFVPINRHDPNAPPEWNLLNTPMSARWSLQIAAYEGPERKAMTVESVRTFREHGIEAYYFHGETISSICIGTWPVDALKPQDLREAQTNTSTEILLVFASPLPPGPQMKFHDVDGNDLTPFAPRLEVVDATLAKAIRDFPNHAVNGEVLVKTSIDGEKFASPSFLVLIPHGDGTSPPLSPLAVPRRFTAGRSIKRQNPGGNNLHKTCD